MNSGKCPKCGAVVEHVKLEPIASTPVEGKSRHEGVSYLCRSCDTVLGVELKPVSLQEETLEN